MALFPILSALAVIGIIYGALVALAQTDIKRLVAYSSVSHMGFIVLGMFACNGTGMDGSVIQMVNHGLTTGALFACVGVLYERYHTRQMNDVGGLWNRLPVLAFFFMLAALGSAALPGLNGFVGEFPILMGMFAESRQAAVLGATGMILGACYLLWMLRKVVFGPLREPHAQGHEAGSPHTAEPDHPAIRPVGWYEMAGLVPLMVLIVLIGTVPGPFLARIRPAVAVIDDNLQRQRGASDHGRAGPAEHEAGKHFRTQRRRWRQGRRRWRRWRRWRGCLKEIHQGEPLMTPQMALHTVEQTLLILMPEILLLLAGIGMMTASPFVRLTCRSWCTLAATALFVALIGLLLTARLQTDMYAAVALNDSLGFYGRLMAILTGMILLALAHEEPQDDRAGEFFGALLMITTGAMLVTTANELVFLFVGLELVSMPTYLLLYLSRRTATTQEAATKYFYLSIFSSGLLLFGLAYLYGVAGVSNLKALAVLSSLPGIPHPQLGLIAIVFILAGLSFRVAAVPFHFYAPTCTRALPQ